MLNTPRFWFRFEIEKKNSECMIISVKRKKNSGKEKNAILLNFDLIGKK